MEMRSAIGTIGTVIVSLILFNAVAGTVRAEEAPVETTEQSAAESSMFSTEIWLTPLILLPGVALLIGSTSARFGQLHTEFHRLIDHPDQRARLLGRHLLKRSAIFRNALVALYGSVSLFAIGSLLGGVVNLWQPESLWVVGGLTIAGIGCIVYASIQLLWDALICLEALQEYHERIEAFTPARPPVGEK
jgi:hypothetical protein